MSFKRSFRSSIKLINHNSDKKEEISLIYPNKQIELKYGTIPDKNRGKRIKIFQSGKDDIHNKDEKTSGILGMFRYSSKGDKLLMIIGLLFALLHGASLPILALVFGRMTNTFIVQATQGFKLPENEISILNSSVKHFENVINEYNDRIPSATLSTTSESSSLEDEMSSPMTPVQFTHYMGTFSMYYLCIGLGVLITSYIQVVCWELAAEKQIHRLHQVFFGQVLRQDITWYDLRTKDDGDLTTKLADDLERIREGIGSKFSMVVQYISTFFSGIAVGFIANWQLTSAILCIGPILIGTSAYMARTSSSTAAREQEKYSFAGCIADEVLNSLRTVVAFGGEFKEIKRYHVALEEGKKIAMKKYYIIAFGIGAVFFIMYASFGLAFWFGAELIGAGVSTPGSVFTVFFSVMAGAFSVGNALPFVNSVSTAVGAASTIFNVIDRLPDIDPYSKTGFIPSVDRKFMSDDPTSRIKFNNVRFSYPARPDVQVLRGLDLNIESGKTVALVGESGSGKSTVVSLLLRFYDPTCGEIVVDGIPLREYNVPWFRNQIGVVSQEPVLFGMTIADNIKYGFPTAFNETNKFAGRIPDVSMDDIIKAATLANAHQFITALPKGYRTKVGDHGAQLSGGQKQRIAIARAIIRDPKILLLDEATSALDSHSEGLVQEALEKAMKGRTTIIVAHRLSTIRNADVIYVLKDGVVGEFGNHDELMSAQGLYYNLVTSQTANTPEDSDDEDTGDQISDKHKNEITLTSKEWKKMSRSIKKMDSPGKKPHDKSEYNCINDEYEQKSDDDNQTDVMWRLLKLNSPEWYWVLFGLIGCSVSGITMPVFAFFYGEMFSTFTLLGDELESAARFWTLMFFALALISGSFYILQILSLSSAAENLLSRIRLMAFQNILRQPVGWSDSDENSPGKLITKLARDAPMLRYAAGVRAGHLVSAGVTLMAALTIAFIYGWQLACMLLIGIPLIAGASYHQTAIIRRNQLRDLKYMDNAGRVASECVSNIRTVQSLSKEKVFLQLYTDYIIEPYREAKYQGVVFAMVFSFSQAIIFVMYAAAFRFGAYLIEHGDMTPTDVYRVFFALAFCAAAIGQTAAYGKDYLKAKLSAESLFKLIDTKSSIDVDSRIGIKPIINGRIEFDSVHFCYPSRPDTKILRGMSFVLEPGKTLALVGESGCGKSTIVSLLERFYDPLSGSVMIDRFNIRSINVRYLRSNIGLVTQEPVLFNCSIKDNILYGLQDDLDEDNDNDIYNMDQVIGAAKAANIHNFIINLPQGYDTPVGAGGSKLSGGQKQRIAIARALIRDPKILLLDEATSALDTESEKVVQEALDRARQGRTCIIVAHRLSTIQNADTIAVVHHGVIVEQGTHEELKNKQQRYYQLIKRQNI
ncbi:ATP-dependent translocase ABCB1-like [Lycorma delicatula]|uniref:ATP-dependent translocase ABCB1-like n=1 Tax=Lycorma delicatula TaxID=130591 RepID=UPI003F514F5D